MNLKSAKLNSLSSCPIYVLLPIFHILVNGNITTKLSKSVTRFFLYGSISFSFCLQMATKTYLLIFWSCPCVYSIGLPDSSFFPPYCAQSDLSNIKMTSCYYPLKGHQQILRPTPASFDDQTRLSRPHFSNLSILTPYHPWHYSHSIIVLKLHKKDTRSAYFLSLGNFIP